MDVFLVRHGAAASTWTESPDPGLSDLGHQQAAASAFELTPQLPGSVGLISSPLLRARETATPLSDKLGLDVKIIEAFREIPAPVELEFRQQWLKSIMKERWTDQDVVIREWRHSIIESLRGLGGPTVVYTHFMVLNAIVAHAQGLDQVVCFLPDNASVTRIRIASANDASTSIELVEKGREIPTVVM